MDRRNFLATMGMAGAGLAWPGMIRADLTSLSGTEIEARVNELLGKMTLSEKIKQMSGENSGYLAAQVLGYNKFFPTRTPDDPRLGIPGIKFVDGPRGINFNHSTCFPVSMARGASWDADLQKRVGEVMGYEAKARGANYTGAVCINVLRHSSWGRSQETFGEDPFHLGAMGSSFALGIQKYIMACAKHYACNNIEGSRQFVDVKIPERTLREIYLPHFKTCVDAGVASVMCAYNIVNGQYCSANKHLITDILKNDWGFSGFIVSDFGAVHDGEAAANSGLDVEMPNTTHWGPRLEKLVGNGKVAGSRIDDAVTRILRQKIRFGLMNLPVRLDASKVAGKEHAAVALEAERKSIVLLKNEGRALPIERGSVKSIAVFGALADKQNIGDRGSSIVRPPYVITPLAGIREKAGNGIEVWFEPGTNLDAVEKLAAKADAAVVVAGCTWMDEGEAHDRLDLNLSDEQERLIKTVAAANKRTIVVLEAGGAITMKNWKDAVPSIVMSWYPGMEGGNAIAEILFGDANPCGKLPIVFPKSADQLLSFDNRARSIAYGYYHGYRWFDKKGLDPAYPFGFGMSYTNYKYSNIRLSNNIINKDNKLEVILDVENQGKRSGEEIVQLYVAYNGSKIDRPVKDLRAFGKVALEPGAIKTVSLIVNPADLRYWDESKGGWQLEDLEYTVMVGPSSRTGDLLPAGGFKIKR